MNATRQIHSRFLRCLIAAGLAGIGLGATPLEAQTAADG